MVAPTAEENAKAEAFFAGFDKQSFKIDPVGPTAELMEANERLSVKAIASALLIQQLQESLAVANELIQWHEATIERLESEVERMKPPLKKLVRAWRYGDCDESLLDDAEEIVKDAEQALSH